MITASVCTTGISQAKLLSMTEKKNTPNIIFIMADDLGYGDLGCYGAKHISTPHCDRMAQEGIRFTDAHSSSAVCSPTRYSVLTGRYAWRTWLKNWVLQEWMPLLIDPKRLTIASMLKQYGYATGCIGKWHLGLGSDINPDWNTEIKPGPLEVGFDYFFGVPFSHNSSPQLQVFVQNRRIYGLREGEKIQDEKVQKRVHRRLEDTAVEITKRAVNFIEQNKDGPFFLYLPTTNIHFPLTPNERFIGKSGIGKYGDFVAEFDWTVGQVLKTLDDLNMRENTLIIVTSDNGGWINPVWTFNGHKPNGNWRGGKMEIYEGGHRVPFIARWPGKIKPNSQSDETICLTDFVATCAGIVGHELQPSAAEDSYNILPVLLDRKYNKPLREATIHHSVSGMFAIRQGRWKLIEGIGNGLLPQNWLASHESGIGKPVKDSKTGQFKDLNYYWPSPPNPGLGQPAGQLYNLETDPGEENNLWQQHPDIVKELLGLLNHYRRP